MECVSELACMPEYGILCDAKDFVTTGLKTHPSLLVCVSGYYYLVIVEANIEMNRI